MKKKLLIILFLISIISGISALDLEIISVGRNISYRDVTDMFFDDEGNLITFEPAYNGYDLVVHNSEGECIFRKSHHERVYPYDKKNRFLNKTPSDFTKKTREIISIEKGVKIELEHGYSIQLLEDILEPEVYDKDYTVLQPHQYDFVPHFFYIFDSTGKLVLNYNAWRINQEELYPDHYYNSRSEKIYFTKEKQIRQLKRCLASISINTPHIAVNEKGNKISIELHDYDGNESGRIFFNVIYTGVINDFRVRIRTEPNLDSEILSLYYEGDTVEILDRSDEKYEIDGESWYWYKVRSGSYPEGWVYGKYIDIE